MARPTHRGVSKPGASMQHDLVGFSKALTRHPRALVSEARRAGIPRATGTGPWPHSYPIKVRPVCSQEGIYPQLRRHDRTSPSSRSTLQAVCRGANSITIVVQRHPSITAKVGKQNPASSSKGTQGNNHISKSRDRQYKNSANSARFKERQCKKTVLVNRGQRHPSHSVM